jgi:hypothetical protein
MPSIKLEALISFALFNIVVCSSCSDNTPVCAPKIATNDCICKTGDRGHHVCADDGLSVGDCVCGTVSGAEGGAGAGGAAGTAGSAARSKTGGGSSDGGSSSVGGAIATE